MLHFLRNAESGKTNKGMRELNKTKKQKKQSEEIKTVVLWGLVVLDPVWCTLVCVRPQACPHTVPVFCGAWLAAALPPDHLPDIRHLSSTAVVQQ